MGRTGNAAALRRRVQIVLLCVELGAGGGLIGTATLDSTRPLRDILVGVAAGLLLGLSVVEPVEHLARRAAARRGRHGVHPAAARPGRHAVHPATARPGRHAVHAAAARHGRHGVRRAAAQAELARQPDVIVFQAVPWPDPELSEFPRPTFGPPPPR